MLRSKKLSLKRKQCSSLLPSSYSSDVFVGITNLGNTCYCNAVLQALRCCPRVLVSIRDQDSFNSDSKNITQVLSELIREIESSGAGAVSPLELLKVMRKSGTFVEGLQHDAQEFLSYLLTNYAKVESLTTLFQGTLQLRSRCLDCDKCTVRNENFLNVSVPVMSEEVPGYRGCSISLSWCLSRFMSQERLTGENKLWCESCRHLVEAERNMVFHHLPYLFTVHLKRFQVHGDGETIKLASNVAIPLILNLKPWSVGECYETGCIYRLCAVVLHCGSSCNSGHYTSLVKFGKEWLYCDDENVTPVSTIAVIKILSPIQRDLITPYILFFCSASNTTS